MNVLSLFDGLSGAQLALNKAGIKYDKYYASEINKYAIAVTQYRFPETIQLGDVSKIKADDLPAIDLVIAGFPCTNLSISKRNREGLEGAQSGLFYEAIRLLNDLTPTYFLIENVASMPKKDKMIITDILGVEPIMINSALLSAQNRKRLYWTNINGIEQPEDKEILLKDILEPLSEVDERMVMNGKAFTLTASYNGAVEWNSVQKKQRTMVRDKSGCIQSTYYKENLKSMDKRGKTNLFVSQKPIKIDNIGNDCKSNRVYLEDGNTSTTVKKDSMLLDTEKYIIRKLTPKECERLQTVPDDYTLVPHPVYKNRMMSNTQRYKMLGNGFTIDVIAHILSYIK